MKLKNLTDSVSAFSFQPEIPPENCSLLFLFLLQVKSISSDWLLSPPTYHLLFLSVQSSLLAPQACHPHPIHYTVFLPLCLCSIVPSSRNSLLFVLNGIKKQYYSIMEERPLVTLAFLQTLKP